MSQSYPFKNDFPETRTVIEDADLGSDVIVFANDGFLTITYKGTDSSQWFGFILNQTSDVIVAGDLGRSGGNTRFNDNNQAQADAVQLWVNDNMLNAPGTTWQDDTINFFTLSLQVVQTTPATPNLRTYAVGGTGRQSTLARQPGLLNVRAFRTS